MSKKNSTTKNDSNRRSFFEQAMAVAVGAVTILVPIGSAIAVLLSPLGKKSHGNFIRLTSLDAVPPDGVPRPFPAILKRRDDAWSVYRNEPVGLVYLRRTDEATPPIAFTATCPHLGCSVDCNSDGEFRCPCHNSLFKTDGTRINSDSSPSPRDLDTLEVEIRNNNEVWVDYKKFVGGKTDKLEE